MHVGDIDVIIDVYIYIVAMECKKLQFSGSLPSAWAGALGKVFFFKKNFAECLGRGTRQSIFF